MKSKPHPIVTASLKTRFEKRKKKKTINNWQVTKMPFESDSEMVTII